MQLSQYVGTSIIAKGVMKVSSDKLFYVLIGNVSPLLNIILKRMYVTITSTFLDILMGVQHVSTPKCPEEGTSEKIRKVDSCMIANIETMYTATAKHAEN